ncbi:MAG: hypothetical protein HQM10_10215 [Candidatus Riflebacteria bacterium]|nr:hypothetical protein [Candidatus Riflebacteria bacterium]
MNNQNKATKVSVQAENRNIKANKSDYDSAWKILISKKFKRFIQFFFPGIHDDISWKKGYVFLDAELQKIVRNSVSGKRYVDKLVRVTRKNGSESCIFIHIEVQSTRDGSFAKRMYTYNYRISDRFDKPVASLAILADIVIKWRPSSYHKEIWGCSSDFKYPVIKLTDFEYSELEKQFAENPFAVITYAHLKAKLAGNNDEKKFATKFSVIRALLKNGYPKNEISDIMVFIDWILHLPDDLEQKMELEILKENTEKEAPKMYSKYSISQKFADLERLKKEKKVVRAEIAAAKAAEKTAKAKAKAAKATAKTAKAAERTAKTAERTAKAAAKAALTTAATAANATQKSTIVEILSNKFGKVPGKVFIQIENVNNLESLKKLTLKAALTDSIQDFIDLLNDIFSSEQAQSKTSRKKVKASAE